MLGVSLSYFVLYCQGHYNIYIYTIAFLSFRQSAHTISPKLIHTAVPRELVWWSRTAELINSVGHFCLLLFVFETCCRRGLLVVGPWALLRVLWTYAFSSQLDFALSLFRFFFFCCSIACLVSWSRSRYGL